MIDLERACSAFNGVAEDGLNRGLEEPGKFEGQRKTGIVLARLDRVDGLARDAKFLGKIGLRPAALGAKDTETVFHAYSLPAGLRRKRTTLAIAVIVMKMGKFSRMSMRGMLVCVSSRPHTVVMASIPLMPQIMASVRSLR